MATKATYFASGSNAAGEIRGFGEIGHAVGAAVPEIIDYPDSIAELKALAGTGVPAFLDSGAFSEVAFDENGPRVVAPIADADWRRRLALYVEVGTALGASLSVVAPDMVGFPEETLARLERYRAEVAAVVATGARVLVALQGADKVEFWARVRALDLAPEGALVPAIPMKKNATTADEVVRFVAAVRPRSIHLLGLGRTNRAADDLLAALAAVAPETEVTMDSNLIRANVQRTGRVRKMTRALDESVEELRETMWAEGLPADAMGPSRDYTDLVSTPSAWATAKALGAMADHLGLEGAARRALVRDVDAWLADESEFGVPRAEMPHVAFAVDVAWDAAHWDASAHERKRRAVRKAFGKAAA